MVQETAVDLALDSCRGYLLLLVLAQWDRRFQGRLDPEDVVQQTLQEAHKQRAGFRGTSEGELKAWLRTILTRNLVDLFHYHRQGKRDLSREQSLEDGLGASSARLEAWVAAAQSSPSERAAKNETLTRLHDALGRLPPDQREAVVLHHLRGLALADLARAMERTEASVAGLLRRGLKTLRARMDEGD